MTEYNGGSIEADHLCVLVHGVRFDTQNSPPIPTTGWRMARLPG